MWFRCVMCRADVALVVQSCEVVIETKLCTDTHAQLDFAPNAIDFLHRVGRTGRAGKAGKVTSMYRRVWV